MRRLVLVAGLLAAGVASAAAREVSPFFARHVVTAKTAGKIPMDGVSGPWEKAAPLPLTFWRQRTLRLNDRDANALLDAAGPRTGEVRALQDKDTLALAISWEDAAPDQLGSEVASETDAFGDAVAVELPVEYGAGKTLPYVGMGDEKHPVALHFVRQREGGAVEQHFVAAGFGSLTRVQSGTTTSMTYDAAAHRWTAVFAMPLQDAEVDLRQGLLPVGFAVWDGANRERGGYKAISGWQFVRLARFDLDKGYLAEVSWGEDGTPVGSAEKGATLATQNCAACHRLDTMRFATEGIAPDLASVGAYALASYLRDSIRDPDHVVIRSRNPNQHYDKNAPRSDLGHHPPNEGYRWYTLGDDGATHSKMPKLAHLSDQDVADLVTYLKTLAPKPAPGATP